MTEAVWTLDELTERVGAALSVGYDGQPSGRVRDLPDQRAIRWYTTIGLVDRPAATRGRTAMYGPRHLLQLVAIKRLQAQGRSLVAIQAELAGATDAQLARVARLAAPERRRPAATEAPADRASVAPAAATAPAEAPAALARPPDTGQGTARHARFWRERPAETAVPAAVPGVATEDLPVATLQGVRLDERATLLLDSARPLDDADLRAILDAARPLLEALRARGLDGGHPPGREHP
jgi:DNA-binding transcriptional MerR regulator